jgi:hypothetical protein
VLAVLLVAAAFAVIYLVAANVVLRTRLLRDLVSEGPDVELSYDSAYSVWPGLVHVRGLELQVQVYAHQLSIAAESGQIQVSLHELLLRRFHATRVSLAGFSFRLRDRLPASELNSPRVAAYPPIPGFPEPLLVGEKPPPTPDAAYDAWLIRLEGVRAELRELWFFEYHYLGAGLVRGGFELSPARDYAVYPASVSLQGGELSIGESLGVQQLSMGVEGYIDFTDVRKTQGLALVEKMSGRVSLDARTLRLGVLDSRAPAGGPPRVDGRADLVLAASVTRGRLDAQSTAELVATELAVQSPIGKVSGPARLSLATGPDGRIDWLASSSELAVSSAARQPGPVLKDPRLAVTLKMDPLGQTPELRSVELDVPELSVPSLAWAERWLDRSGTDLDLSGRLEGRAHLSLVMGRGPALRLRLGVKDAELSSGGVHAALAGRVEAELTPVAGPEPSSAGRLDIELDGVEVERDREKAKPFRVAVRLPDLRLALEPEPTLTSSVDVFAKPADSLLSLALGSSVLEDLAADLLALRRLEARAQVAVSERSLRFELSRAVCGALTGTGFWQRPAAGGARGAFLISSKVANVGISLSGSDTETAWFVPDDWLSRARSTPTPRAPQSGAGPGDALGRASDRRGKSTLKQVRSGAGSSTLTRPP